jgi:diadenylate cyclase
MLQALAQGFAFDPSLILTVLDTLIVAYLIYRGLLVIRGTRAAPMLWGLILITLLFLVAKQVGLQTLSWILGNFLSSIILVIVVVFQDELRRGLTKMGLQRFFLKSQNTAVDKVVEDLAFLLRNFSENRVGALIVLQRTIGLDEFLEEAVALDALVNRKLLASIFMKESPLHDGAVVIHGDRIKAAGCVLPLSFNPDLDPNLGTRHRAALGLSERSDAIVIVVSEENGSISVAAEGKLLRNVEPGDLRRILSAPLEGDPLYAEADRIKPSSVPNSASSQNSSEGEG